MNIAAALDPAVTDFCKLLRSLDPDDASRPVPGLEWTVGDAAAHVLTVVRRALGDLRRSATARETAELNATCLSEVVERDPHVLAEEVREGMDRVLNDVIPQFPPEMVIPFHGGISVRLETAFSIMLGEFLVHGWDIARACRRDWRIDREHALIMWRAVAEVLPAWLRPGAADGVHETYEVRFPEESFVFRIDDGTISVTGDGAADHVIEEDPVDLLLAFPCGRVPYPNETVARLAGFFEPV